MKKSHSPLSSLSLRFKNLNLQVLDQQLLPAREVWLNGNDPLKMISYIKSLKVRGAPMIGVAAALSLAVFAHRKKTTSAKFNVMAEKLREARPTAVNLMHAMDVLIATPYSPDLILKAAIEIFQKDVELCASIAGHGSKIIRSQEGVLTHCNTGGLATAGVGTALGILRQAHEERKGIHVYACETRPLLQGGRLTSWELMKLKIPSTLICDSMAAILMAQGKINKVIVGADRIARNGDFANKVGTYSLAVLAHHHNIPFFVAAPWTTVDSRCQSGQDIPIEERDSEEVTGAAGGFGKVQWAPKRVKVFNPAFDVTPAQFVTGWILDRGVYDQAAVKKGVFSV